MTIRATINISMNRYRAKRQMYFNQVVYGTSKYDRPIISNRLVGPIMLINPYRLWNKIATSSKFALSENAFTSGKNVLDAV